jgi:hypothetical protein
MAMMEMAIDVHQDSTLMLHQVNV